MTTKRVNICWACGHEWMEEEIVEVNKGHSKGCRCQPCLWAYEENKKAGNWRANYAKSEMYNQENSKALVGKPKFSLPQGAEGDDQTVAGNEVEPGEQNVASAG